MDPERPPSIRHRLLLATAGLVGAVVLYVLSAGPACYLIVRFNYEGSRVRQFYLPAVWVIEGSPLQPPLEAYVTWWGKQGYVQRKDH